MHIRYIQLQGVLQNKMAELDRLCAREREIIEGKWKTHSLPARKKNSNQNTTLENGLSDHNSYNRPALSTEDVAKIPPVTLAYRYLDSDYRSYVLQPGNSENFKYV